jgi:BolA family transcriptional regulator, general stress-responsive regulator
LSTADLINERLASLGAENIEIYDDSEEHAGHAGAREGGGHFQVLIVAEAFEGLSRVLRHRMVYDAIGPLMQGPIHALAIRAYTPDEFQTRA